MGRIEPIDWNSALKQAQSGDHAARELLGRALEVRLWPILQSRLWGWSKSDLADILQNTLLVVMEKLSQIEDNPHFFALKTLRFKIGDALRRSPGRHETDIESLSHSDNPDTDANDRSGFMTDPDSDFTLQLEAGELAERIRAAIKRLSKFCQLFFLAVLENRQICDVWETVQECEPELKRSAFDKRIFDCRRKLRDLLEGAMKP